LVGWKDVELVDRKVDWLVVLKVQKSADSKAVNLDVKMVGQMAELRAGKLVGDWVDWKVDNLVDKKVVLTVG
jgi:hypothetical protein